MTLVIYEGPQFPKCVQWDTSPSRCSPRTEVLWSVCLACCTHFLPPPDEVINHISILRLSEILQKRKLTLFDTIFLKLNWPYVLMSSFLIWHPSFAPASLLFILLHAFLCSWNCPVWVVTLGFRSTGLWLCSNEEHPLKKGGRENVSERREVKAFNSLASSLHADRVLTSEITLPVRWPSAHSSSSRFLQTVLSLPPFR